MSVLNRILLSANRLLASGDHVHPLTLERENEGAYARWEYDLAIKTLGYFPGEFVETDQFVNKKVLDLCCGAGGKTVLLAEMGANVVGVDIGSDFIQMAKDFAKEKSSSATFKFGDARNLDFADNTFDFVFSFDALEHVDPPNEMLAEARRVLKPGGRLILSFTNWERHDGHHMTDAISLPWVHLIISQKRLLTLYRLLVDDQMYILRAGSAESETIAYVNRLKLKKAKKLIDNSGMKKLYYEETKYSGILGLLSKIPGMKKYFTRVIIAVLEA